MQALVQGTSWNGYRVEQSPVLLVQVDEPALVTAERIDIRGFHHSDQAIAPNSISEQRLKTQKTPIARSLSPNPATGAEKGAIGDGDRTAIGGDQIAIAVSAFANCEDKSIHQLPSDDSLTCTLQPGDKVEIIQEGQFYGKHVFVVFLARRGRVKVRGKDWAIDRFYQRSELRLIQKAGGQSHADG
jgi:hypothetical protein